MKNKPYLIASLKAKVYFAMFPSCLNAVNIFSLLFSIVTALNIDMMYFSFSLNPFCFVLCFLPLNKDQCETTYKVF